MGRFQMSSLTYPKGEKKILITIITVMKIIEIEKVITVIIVIMVIAKVLDNSDKSYDWSYVLLIKAF